MEKIREKFGFERWMVVGGSWGATLALAYAQAHPERVSGIALRATFLGTRAEVETAFLAPAAILSGALEDFLSVLPPDERAQPVDAYCRRILDADPAVHGPASRAWHDTERVLSEHKAAKTRLDLASLNIGARCPRRRSWRRIISSTTASCGEPVVAECRQTCRHSRHHRAGPLRSVVPARDIARARESCGRAEIRIVEEAGHSLYDPGVRDAVMKSIADLASQNHEIGDKKCHSPGKACC